MMDSSFFCSVRPWTTRDPSDKHRIWNDANNFFDKNVNDMCQNYVQWCYNRVRVK